ncbi:hypothetical protein FP2506_04270 [Fulvimarina pelagi HTCC2506]|uniref:Flagellar basal body L-ring protein n=1 Tax=Fulvimarina pelagi HTCC2506 TaxID=314231 RepID=Q0FZ64_9HYPH|nr:hypothetical protein [Fulvimarina pelagi]EAU40414.1 hypothetical protein FP2506_04270 [Fulvimarina pelagi HTCC2506]
MNLIRRIGLLAGLALAGCAPAPRGLPDIAAFPSPDDPSIVSPMGGAGSVVGSYTPRSVAEPQAWRNRGVPLEAVPEAGQ